MEKIVSVNKIDNFDNLLDLSEISSKLDIKSKYEMENLFE